LHALRQRIVNSGAKLLNIQEVDEMSDEGIYCRACGAWVEWSDWIVRDDNDYCPHCNAPLANDTELEALRLLQQSNFIERLISGEFDGT